MGNRLMVLPPTEMKNAGSNSDLEDSKFSTAHVVKGFGACPVGMVAGFGSPAALAPSAGAAGTS